MRQTAGAWEEDPGSAVFLGEIEERLPQRMSLLLPPI